MEASWCVCVPRRVNKITMLSNNSHVWIESFVLTEPLVLKLSLSTEPQGLLAIPIPPKSKKASIFNSLMCNLTVLELPQPGLYIDFYGEVHPPIVRRVAGEQCVICSPVYTTEVQLDPEVVEVQLDCCAHPFCLSCILTWSNQSRTCPTCNRVFEKILGWDEEGKSIHHLSIFSKGRLRDYLNSIYPQFSSLTLTLCHDVKSIRIM